ncbi:MAG: ABC transporter ATP-binding protein, partial [Erysipelotrichaceae bacterium]|nr:ABC transporter ATP-binding protein [Erysipelotrichaceae bacterium]
MPLLKVENLTTSFTTPQGKVQAVRDVSFELNEGEVLGIVGESGSGKSQMMYTIMGLLADNGVIESGKITFDGEDISLLDFPDKKSYDRKMLDIRGNKMAMIFQDPMTFLNPVLKIETQLVEPLMNHTNMTREQARERALELMRLVGIPSPEKRIKQYPFEFSGGMRQRII